MTLIYTFSRVGLYFCIHDFTITSFGSYFHVLIFSILSSPHIPINMATMMKTTATILAITLHRIALHYVISHCLAYVLQGITTTRLRTFRLRHFVYRHFVYRYFVYYDVPC